MSSRRGSNRKSLLYFILAALLALAPALAEAKMGGGGSMGSRGSRTFSAPPPTRTAPSTAAPMERTITPPPSAGPSAATQGPSAAMPGAAPRPSVGGGFGRGLMGGLAGGLLGAGLFGLLTGHGFFGGIGGLMSIIGVLLQIGILVFLARLAFMWFTGRQAATAGPGGPRPGPDAAAAFTAQPGFGGGAAPGPRPQVGPIRPTPDDFNAFERLLSQTQAAYSHEDADALRRMTTPEMARYFEEELAANRAKGVVNRISDVKLLQGDLSEAWREGQDEYASVAMRFELTDVMEDRATGKPVSGGGAPSQSTELWTFRRPAGSGPEAWRLSAIQQAG